MTDQPIVTEDDDGFLTAGRYSYGPTATAEGLREEAAALLAVAAYLDQHHNGCGIAWKDDR